MSRLLLALLALMLLIACPLMPATSASSPEASCAQQCCCREGECTCAASDDASPCTMQSSDALALEPARSARVAAGATLCLAMTHPDPSPLRMIFATTLQCKDGAPQAPFRPPRLMLG